MKVALVHDWLTGMRGGEKVLESLCRIFPDADIFTLVYVPDRISSEIRSHRVTTSFLNRIPGAGRLYRNFLPLMPRAIESFDLREYDLVISSSHAVAKGVRARNICYCHTPLRYVWLPVEGVGGIRGNVLRVWKTRLRDWDLESSKRVTHFIANSENVRRRIQAAYGRDAVVRYPPVDTDFFTPAGGAGDYYLVVSALEPYKRVDLAIRAANRLGKRLVVAGRGSLAKSLRKMAGPQVEFTGWVTDERLRELYRGCRALLFPGIEDFGMVPVEAQACGRPVIAYRAGGALESVVPGRTGVFFDEQTEESLVAAITEFESASFEPAEARQNSIRFSRGRFETGFAQAVEQHA